MNKMNGMNWILASSLFIIGVVWCQEDILKQLPSQIPLELPNDLDISNIESEVVESYAKDALTLLKQKCANTSGGDDVYHNLENDAKDLQTYIINKINFTQIMLELDEAKKTGSMDEVFAKYCAYRPEVLSRFKNITSTFKQCLLPEEQKSLDDKSNMTEHMLHYLCEKDGDKMAMFIATGGEECLTQKVDGLQECFNKSSTIFPSDDWQSLTLPEIDEKICEEFPVLQQCVVAVLENCDKSKTPANIIGSVFKYVRRNMDCAPQKQPVVAGDVRTFPGGNAYAIVSSLALIIASLLVTLA